MAAQDPDRRHSGGFWSADRDGTKAMAVTVSSALELRPYQRDALDRTYEAEARGVRRQLGVAATGLGKTIIFCALARERGGRTLVIVHREELVRQAWAKVHESWPDVEVGIVKAQEDDVYAQVVIASIQTLARPKRLGRLLATMTQNEGGLGLARLADRFRTIVVDEAHHAHADSYRKVLTALRAGEPGGERAATPEEVDNGCELGVTYDDPGPLLLGVTATPDRGDGAGLDDLFDEVVWNYDILWGIRAGFLADVRAKRITLDALDLGKVKVSRGDYEQGAVGRAMENADAPDLIVKAWQEHAPDRRTLVFMPTVALAESMAEKFRAAGVRAGWISGETPYDQRRATLDMYSTGALQVLVNCMVLTEGYDEPRTDCVIAARPTKNRALFTQMIGRGTRKHPDKADLLVLDVAGSSETLSLVTVPSLLGLPVKEGRPLEDGTGLLSDVAQAFDDQRVRLGLMRAEDADLFKKLRGNKIAWVPTHRDDEHHRYEVAIGNMRVVVTRMRGLDGEDDGWLCGLQEGAKKRVLIGRVSLELAQGVGEDAVRKLTVGSPHLADPDAPWRKKSPSKKQRNAAHKCGVKNVNTFKTAGELSDAITQSMSQRRRASR